MDMQSKIILDSHTYINRVVWLLAVKSEELFKAIFFLATRCSIPGNGDKLFGLMRVTAHKLDTIEPQSLESKP